MNEKQLKIAAYLMWLTFWITILAMFLWMMAVAKNIGI